MGDFSHLTFLPINGKLSENTLFHAQSSYRPEESVFNPAYLKVKSQRYQLSTTLVPSMFGAILEMEGAVTDPGLGISLPGRYQLQQVDEGTVIGTVINYSGCEDKDLTLHFSLRFETAVHAIEGALSGENGFVVIRFA